MKRLSLRGVRLALLTYALFDIFVGGFCGGFLPLTIAAPQAIGQNALPGVTGNPSPTARPAGVFYAPGFASQSLHVLSGNSATGTASITIVGSTGGIGGIQLADGTTISLQTVFSTLTPLIVDYGQAAAEFVTPTAVSVGTCPAGNLGVGGVVQCATFTGTFANTHGQSAQVFEGTGGVQTAVNYAQQLGGGQVTIDPAWGQMVAGIPSITGAPASVAALLNGLVPFANVSIYDARSSAPQYWNPQGGGTTLAAPATLINATAGFGVNGANFTTGFYTGSSTYIACIAYVDIYGQEGPCSATFTIATSGVATTDQIGFTAPAASTGAVGYTIYIDLAGGSYNLSYKVPLATYVGGVPTANGVCTLTKLETTTAACALTNSTYNQTGVGAVVSALTVNTSPINPQVTAQSSGTTVLVPNAGGRTVYTYIPGSHVGTPGIPDAFLPYTISAAEATTNFVDLGQVNLPSNFMNFVGRTIEVCGKATTSASTATIAHIEFFWDSIGQNTAGLPVLIGNLAVTPVAAFSTTAVYTFCDDFETTVAGAGATAGSINTIGGYLNTSGVSAAAAGQAAGSDATIGATASLNLANEGRLHVMYTHTTNTDGTALTLQSLTVKVLN
jgi:hypothetical protein